MLLYSGPQGAKHGVGVVAGVAEEHAGVLIEEQRVAHAGVASAHAAFHHDHRAALPDLQHRHAGDGAGGVVLGAGIDNVVGPDHKDDISAGQCYSPQFSTWRSMVTARVRRWRGIMPVESLQLRIAKRYCWHYKVRIRI